MNNHKEAIQKLKDEVQCMESCLRDGFTLKEYIECQKHLIEILKVMDNEKP